MIIDIHTHAFPDKIAKRTIAVLEANAASFGQTPVKALYDGDIAGLSGLMQQCGIDYALVLPIATSTTQATSINNYAAQINGQDGILSFGSLHPEQSDWEETLCRIKNLGLRGIKLHPEYQQFYIDAPESVRILKKCAQLDLAVMLHTGADIGMPPPVHCTPEALRHAIDLVPDCTIIAAHMGGWQMWDDVETYLIGTHVFLDTSFSITQMPREQLLRMIKKHTPDRILFGSDAPWESPAAPLAVLEQLALDPEALEKILYKNALNLLKIPYKS